MQVTVRSGTERPAFRVAPATAPSTAGASLPPTRARGAQGARHSSAGRTPGPHRDATRPGWRPRSWKEGCGGHRRREQGRTSDTWTEGRAIRTKQARPTAPRVPDLGRSGGTQGVEGCTATGRPWGQGAVAPATCVSQASQLLREALKAGSKMHVEKQTFEDSGDRKRCSPLPGLTTVRVRGSEADPLCAH